MSRRSWLFVLLCFSTIPVATANSQIADFVELVFFGCILYYADMVTDALCLVQFWERKRYCFFGINIGGIIFNTIASAVPYIINGTLVGCTKETVHDERVQKKLLYFKGCEFIEALASFIVQGYTLSWDRELSDKAEDQLQWSVLIALVSLANGLVTFDKVKADFAEFPIVSSIFSWQFVVIMTFRISELTLSFGAIFLFQLCTRPYGGIIAVGILWLLNITYAMYCIWLEGKFTWKELVTMLALSIPSPFFQCGSVLSKNKHAFRWFPEKRPCFILRLVSLCTMIAWVWCTYNGIDHVWETIDSYNRSAKTIAFAMLGAIVSYIGMYILMECLDNTIMMMQKQMRLKEKLDGMQKAHALEEQNLKSEIAEISNSTQVRAVESLNTSPWQACCSRKTHPAAPGSAGYTTLHRAAPEGVE